MSSKKGRFHREITALKLAGDGNSVEYYGSLINLSKNRGKNEQLSHDEYMIISESMEERIALFDYIHSIKNQPDSFQFIKGALLLALKKHASIQKKSKGNLQLTNMNLKNVLVYESPTGKMKIKVIDTGGQFTCYSPSKWFDDIFNRLIEPVSAIAGFSQMISREEAYSQVASIIGPQFIENAIADAQTNNWNKDN